MHTKKLQVLDLTNCNTLTADLGRIVSNTCPNLETLILHGITNVDDNTLFSLSNLPNLKELDLGLCRNITDLGLANLAKKKPNTLKKIVLTCLLKITNKGLKELIANNTESLVHLTINLLPQKNVDGSEFCEYINKCKNLVHLDLSGISNLQANFLDIIFSTQFEYLISLNVSGLASINDVNIINCLTTCKNLEVVRASNCPALTNGIIDTINSSNDLELKIKYLEINKTPLIADNKIEEASISTLLPNLKISRATNQVWNMKNIGYRVPLIAKDFKKKDPKAKKSAAKSKKNDDKNPVNQLKKLLEENQPKRVLDLFSIKRAKKSKKGKKKK